MKWVLGPPYLENYLSETRNSKKLIFIFMYMNIHFVMINNVLSDNLNAYLIDVLSYILLISSILISINMFFELDYSYCASTKPETKEVFSKQILIIVLVVSMTILKNNVIILLILTINVIKLM